MRPLVPFLLMTASILAGCQASSSSGSDPGVMADAGAGAWQDLGPHPSGEKWQSVSFGGEGEIEFDAQGARLGFGSPLTAIRWMDGLPMSEHYEIEVRAARLDGSDFFCALNFPVGEESATVVLGGWGGALCGLSCVDGNDASMNSTRAFFSFERGQEYCLRVRVDADAIQAWVDGEPLFRQERAGHAFSLRTEIVPAGRLAISSFQTSARIAAVRWRPIR